MIRRTVFVLILTVVFLGCNEKSTKSQGTAPPLPPLASMQVDMAVFNQHNKNAAPDPWQQHPATKLHFANAAVRVAFLNVVLLTALTPPSVAMAAALNTIPSLDGDGGYLWIYTWNDGQSDSQVRLHGTPGGDHIDWELYLSLLDAEPELWFYGRSKSGRKSLEDPDDGYWVFIAMNRSGDPEVVRIDWTVASEGHGTLEIMDIDEASQGYSDELTYVMDDPSAGVTFYDQSEDLTWDIQWNRDGSGSIMAPLYNQGERGCWDTTQEDVACPVP